MGLDVEEPMSARKRKDAGGGKEPLLRLSWQSLAARQVWPFLTCLMGWFVASNF